VQGAAQLDDLRKHVVGRGLDGVDHGSGVTVE
jgi:hypothetical protein